MQKEKNLLDWHYSTFSHSTLELFYVGNYSTFGPILHSGFLRWSSSTLGPNLHSGFLRSVVYVRSSTFGRSTLPRTIQMLILIWSQKPQMSFDWSTDNWKCRKVRYHRLFCLTYLFCSIFFKFFRHFCCKFRDCHLLDGLSESMRRP